MHSLSVAGFTVGTPSSAIVTIRGTDSAPSFGTGSVTNKTFTAGAAITDFTVPAATGGNGAITYAASNLPDGLRFDATGTDSPGCPGTQPREVCGTPTTATAGAQTVTITARDADSNTMNTDRASLTFSVTVNVLDTAPSFGSGSVSNKTYIAGQAITDFTVPAASGGNGAITYTAANLPDGLVFDATGTDSPGCTGTEAREICGQLGCASKPRAPADRPPIAAPNFLGAPQAPTPRRFGAVLDAPRRTTELQLRAASC